VTDQTVRPNFHRVWEFPNGFGASVIRSELSIGHNQGLYELAVVQGTSLCYTSPITDDVIGYLTPRQVVVLLQQIAALQPNERRDDRQEYLPADS
jgi:hypothetical protein